MLQQTPMKFGRLHGNNFEKLYYSKLENKKEIDNFLTHMTHQN
jgi:hypothetical protein